MNSNDTSTGVCPVPPPPPPPPVSGQVPALRINTTENSRSKPLPSDSYEPPAAIQNAMLTKDKKPFTYTPGMGGKLDLSQIRSPRMARRVAKNANDEGIEGPPKSALESKPVPTQAGANIYVQPQVAVPVFPTNMPVQPPLNKTVVNNVNRVPASQPEKVIEPVKTVIRVEQRPTTNSSPSSPETPASPTQVMLTKAPTPWMKRTKSQEEDLPEWARRPNKSQESSPENVTSAPVYVVQSASPPPPPQRNQVPQNFANQRPQMHKRPVNNEQVIPLRIEDRPSVFSVKQEPGHHQFKQPPSTHHQQRWGPQSPQPNQVPIQVQVQSKPQNQTQYRPQDVQASRQNQEPPRPQSQQSGGTYIVPMVIEGRAPSPTGTLIVQSSIPSQTRLIPIQPQNPPANSQRNLMQQGEPGPIQSKSFRVLQKITSTDTPDEVDGDQLRKLQLTEDDKMLMNKFKEQVDNDNYLHQEEDPRYRGAAIPSRAFRYLQNITDAGEITSNTLPRTNNPVNKKQNRNSKNFDEEQQAYLPPSQQQVPEPKKYSGSAIPSRSFRILQAMTEPQSIATPEYHQADYICQTENSMMGNQQAIFFPPFVPNTQFYSEEFFWGFYPLSPYVLPPNSHHYYNYYNAYPWYSTNGTYQVDSMVNQTARDHEIQYQKCSQKVTNGDEIQTRRNSTLLFSPKTTDMTMLTDNTKLSTESRVGTLMSDDTDSDVELSKCESSSSDADSDSYLVYSTGLNPIGKDVKNCRIKGCTSSPSDTTISENTYEQSFSEKQNTLDDCESDEEPSKKEDFESDQQIGPNDTTTTVSVSLPLRLRFSVSENNEDVTTVIVGDSTIKSDANNTVDFTLQKRTTRGNEQYSEDNLHAEFTIKVSKNVEETKLTEGGNEEDKSFPRTSVLPSFETDDEDSGVTSDVSRIISEIDTDSECCPVRRPNKFQRTQTHSRLFKLLTEDLTPDRRKNRLSLPANLTCYQHEEYSSSDDLSWKRLHEMDEKTKEAEDDIYYQTWKAPRSQKNNNETVPSMAHQVLDNRKPQWTYRVNVQCPRIKSLKNVQFSFQHNNDVDNSIPS